MIDDADRNIRDALRAADLIAPLESDLWPRMRARLEAPPPRPSVVDWALAAAVIAVTLAFPQLILGVLYHL